MIASPPVPSGSRRRVRLMMTCLCDAFFDDVAAATVEVLEHVGCEIDVPDAQTCCGQPAFNAGEWRAALPLARRALTVFAGDEPVVIPSGSCARMVSHGALLLFEREPDRGAAAELAERTWELADFLVNALGVTRWPGRLAARAVLHRSCHSRGTRYAEAARALLESIDGVRLIDPEEDEQCCGFGGTFSVRFPSISRAVGDSKLDHLLAAQPDMVISADMGCLMHLEGLARKEGRPIRTLHIAQVLREALAAATTQQAVCRTERSASSGETSAIGMAAGAERRP